MRSRCEKLDRGHVDPGTRGMLGSSVAFKVQSHGKCSHSWRWTQGAPELSWSGPLAPTCRSLGTSLHCVWRQGLTVVQQSGLSPPSDRTAAALLTPSAHSFCSVTPFPRQRQAHASCSFIVPSSVLLTPAVEDGRPFFFPNSLSSGSLLSSPLHSPPSFLPSLNVVELAQYQLQPHLFLMELLRPYYVSSLQLISSILIPLWAKWISSKCSNVSGIFFFFFCLPLCVTLCGPKTDPSP